MTAVTSDGPPSDTERLATYVSVWWEAIDSFLRVAERVPEDAWHTPTDLPGWDVHAVVAHVAHLEALVGGGRPHEELEVGEASHVRSPMGVFTEQGVIARRDDSPDELLAEIRETTTARHTALLADPPTDPDAPAPGDFGASGWSTGCFLRNRPIDVWMHEQDVRRALGKRGGLDSSVARHCAEVMLLSFPMIVGKRAAAPAGTTARLEVEGHDPVTVVVGDDGRAAPAEVADEPEVSLSLDRESFLLLSGGRRPAEPGRVRVDGDTGLADLILSKMAVTP